MNAILSPIFFQRRDGDDFLISNFETDACTFLNPSFKLFMVSKDWLRKTQNFLKWHQQLL